MITVLPDRSETIQKFCLIPLAHQITFQTPLRDLERFVWTFVQLFPIDHADLSTFEVVFEPVNLLRLLSKNSIAIKDPRKFDLQANEIQTAMSLLTAALGDWVDFAFVPTPTEFAIFADHDEYITFYTDHEIVLEKMNSKLKSAGFTIVKNYTRELPPLKPKCSAQ
jgi:hypothetical protein